MTVFCVTFNHAAFLSECLEGFLRQATTFPVEIIIHDDASTDDTQAIIRDYAARYPNIIRPILQTQNQWSAGLSPLRLLGRESRGEFVALCEGDDFWIEADKLEAQIEILRRHPECSACFHNARLVDADGRVLSESYFQSAQTTFTRRDVLDTLLSQEPTCSLVFRRDRYDPLPDWFLRRPCDLFLDLHLASHGPLYFLDLNMAAYRRHGGGIWSRERQAHQLVELIVRFRLLEAEPAFSDADDRELIRRKISEFQAGLFSRDDFDGELARVTRLLGEQNSLIAALRESGGRAQNDVNALNQQVHQLAATVSQQRDYIAEFENAQSATGWIGRLRTHAAGADQTVAEQSALITNLQAQRQQLETYLAELRQETDRQAAVGDEQLRYIRSLETQRDELTSAEGPLVQLRTRVARQDEIIAEQTAFITTLQNERERLERHLAETQREVSRLQNVSREQAEHIRTLEVQRNELTKAR